MSAELRVPSECGNLQPAEQPPESLREQYLKLLETPGRVIKPVAMADPDYSAQEVSAGGITLVGTYWNLTKADKQPLEVIKGDSSYGTGGLTVFDGTQVKLDYKAWDSWRDGFKDGYQYDRYDYVTGERMGSDWIESKAEGQVLFSAALNDDRNVKDELGIVRDSNMHQISHFSYGFDKSNAATFCSETMNKPSEKGDEAIWHKKHLSDLPAQ